MTIMIRYVFLVLYLWLACPIQLIGAEQVASVADPPEDRKLALIEMFSLSNELPRALIDLQNEIDNLWSVSELGENLPGFEAEIKDLEWEVNIAESTPDISYHQLALIDSKLEKTRLRIDHLNRQISTNVDKLQGWYKRWLKNGELLTSLETSETLLNDSGDVKQTIEAIEEVIEAAKELIEVELVPNLVAGKKVGDIQTRLYALNELVINLIEDTNELRIQQTSPSMLSKEFYERLDARAFMQSWESFRLFLMYQWGYVKQNSQLVFMILAVIFVLTLCIRFSRKLVTHSSRWFVFASQPLATAVFLFCTVFLTGNLMAAGFNLPPDWGTLINLPLLLSVACFAEHIVSVQWQNMFLRRLIIFLALTLLLTVINIPQPVFHLFVFCTVLVILSLSFYRFLQRYRDPKQKTITWAIWLWGLFPLVIIIAGMGGYDQLAVLIFGRVLVLVASTVTIWLMLRIISGLLEVALDYFPYSIIRNNASTIVRQLFPFLVLLHGVWWLAVTLMVFWVHPTLTAAFESMTSITFHLFTLEVTPGSILTIISVFYATILISRAVCAFLIQEVLPHYGVEKGVQVSITRLVHYAVLTIGLLVLLRMLGFGLNQIAILGGALSVGIGFGLQAIVNNFVSGLILLFERPIKVGDMIQAGDELGEVKELGLRATTVQTFDNAEIVIPNSELISTSVTNWTLAEKKARVKIPVGVAYGSDIEMVLKILLECANGNPRVLSTPKAQALFLAFGASSLDFELRVWILDVNERMDVLSELNVEIESEFQIAGIEIPFPQTDLHVRSMDHEVAAVFSGDKNQDRKE